MILILILSSCICLFIGMVLAETFETNGFEYVNPFWIYKNIEVNIFGVIIFMIIFNVFTYPTAILYWLYKLCTVGRK